MSHREPISVPQKRATTGILGIIDKNGNHWVLAGVFGAAQPVGHDAEMLELEDLEALGPKVTDIRVVLRDDYSEPVIDATEPGNPRLMDGSQPFAIEG